MSHAFLTMAVFCIGNSVQLRWGLGWVWLKRTCVFSGIQLTRHFIDFFVALCCSVLQCDNVYTYHGLLFILSTYFIIFFIFLCCSVLQCDNVYTYHDSCTYLAHHFIIYFLFIFLCVAVCCSVITCTHTTTPLHT